MTFTSNPQNIDAITATKDLLILVSNKKEVNTERMSVTTKFFKSNLFITLGKCRNEKTKLSQVKNPNNNPSYTLIP